ncbi:Tcp11-domain-containing protein [Lentinula edodes]|uniref:Tcp11-domain-containing protein n=1 Tax=Lentinula edodes TaxID=5353 RepID=A0A1Q3EEU7_LENED|nr:Tcp11-domain-containing protein [Lentinula edodes]
MLRWPVYLLRIHISPQLRHDLMFDNGLQFRPTYSRRKRQLSEAYWTAVIREVESGCTCFSVDKSGAPMMTPACVCNQIPIPPLHPIIAFAERIWHANYIRSIIDPALIEQELRHNLFDLSSLLRAIGVLLKGHCAPMRDSAVEDMVRAADTCKPGGPGTKAEGVNALRTCLEILELMKLDIANHQLQSLRLSISRTSAVYELQNFQAKFADAEGTRSADFKENVVLHIAKRAQQFRETTLDNSPSASSSTLNSPATTPPTSPISEDESPVSPSSPFPHAPYSLSSYNLASPPDTRILNVARRWVVENINIASPLCSVIYDRLHEVVFTGVVAQAYPGRQCTTGQLFSSAIESSAPLRQGGQPYTMPLFSGMEPLVDEIRNLTDKISRVVIMHLNVYLPIYELNGFLEDPVLT